MSTPAFKRRGIDRDTDYTLTREGANQLARRIETVWAEQGHQVECIVVPVRNSNGRILSYTIESDLRNGLPAGASCGSQQVA